MRARILIACTYSIFFFLTFLFCSQLGLFGVSLEDAFVVWGATILMTLATYLPRALFRIERPYSGFFYYCYLIPVSMIYIFLLVYRSPAALPIVVVFILGLTAYTAINAPLVSTLVYGQSQVLSALGAVAAVGHFAAPQAEAFALLVPTALFAMAIARMAGRIQQLRRQVEAERDEIGEQKVLLEEQYTLLEGEKKKSEGLLLNILPSAIAGELKERGTVQPVLFESTTVIFTDFKGFTGIAEKLTPRELVSELDRCFSYFDSHMDRYKLEKLKTIGDSYMCAGGIPVANHTHAIDTVLVALEIQAFMLQMQQIKAAQGLPYWELRIGISSGPLVAGIIGAKKFSYDVWGDTVNTASRMESSGEPGRINISASTYELVKDVFDCEYRGRVPAKNKGAIDMYYVRGLKPEYAQEPGTLVPNERFRTEYRRLQAGRPRQALAV